MSSPSDPTATPAENDPTTSAFTEPRAASPDAGEADAHAAPVEPDAPTQAQPASPVAQPEPAQPAAVTSPVTEPIPQSGAQPQAPSQAPAQATQPFPPAQPTQPFAQPQQAAPSQAVRPTQPVQVPVPPQPTQPVAQPANPYAGSAGYPPAYPVQPPAPAQQQPQQYAQPGYPPAYPVPPAYPGAYPGAAGQVPAPPQPGPSFSQQVSSGAANVSAQATSTAKQVATSAFGRDVAGVWQGFLEYMRGHDAGVARDYMERKYAWGIVLGGLAIIAGWVMAFTKDHAYNLADSSVNWLAHSLTGYSTEGAIELSAGDWFKAFFLFGIFFAILLALRAVEVFCALRIRHVQVQFPAALNVLAASYTPLMVILFPLALLYALPSAGLMVAMAGLGTVVAAFFTTTAELSLYHNMSALNEGDKSLVLPHAILTIVWQAVMMLVTVSFLSSM